ncbi:hypothetical protein FLP10_15350 [Agromyces intestinalis]|uniref:DUF732 domain-containing protein n=1 Tax=Agromyces intestinalis TaxID=2592652 RepID=A0A5C1YJ79_9MICO|nr:hypothetical protein [Agromyces intestinalis]QEO15648.1 hypothetical protein FLP10_15350 [Agromyces intestinalis]
MTAPVRAPRVTLTVAFAALALSLTGCASFAAGGPASSAPAVESEPVAEVDSAPAAEPSEAAEPAGAADTDAAVRVVADAFVSWGYPVSPEVDSMAQMTVSALQPGCPSPAAFLDGFVPSFVNSFNGSNGEAPDVNETDLRPVLDQAIDLACA